MRKSIQLTRQTIINICGTILLAVVIGVCVVERNRIGFERKVPVAEADLLTDTIEVDITQTDVIAAEIRKARQFKARKPKTYQMTDGMISPFDDIFKEYSKTVGWDWRLVAAVSYVESNFKPEVVSKSGAKGLMQLMPRTAANYGCPDSLMQDPEESVKAGTLLLADLESRLRKKNIEHDLVYFTLAGFHAGLGHIYDAITLADSLGYNPTLWHDNVEECLKMKADPEYYKLPYVRLGRFNGNITSAYIREVLDYYDAFQKAHP